MELDEYVIEIFSSHIDTTMQSMDQLTPRISDAATLLVQRLLDERKILTVGAGQCASIADIFCANLLSRYDYERPGLPALNLSADAAVISALASDNGFKEAYSKQIRALGQAGDLLLVVSNNGGSRAAIQAIKAAHDRDLTVISISDQDNRDITALMQPEDIDIVIPSASRARILETQLLIINCLSDLIDQQLFGSH